MRIAVTGASGNIGSHVLEHLHADPAVDGVVAIARRPPEQPHGALADGVTWHAIDISRPGSVAELAAAFAGCDAVVHLAWLIQPSHEPAMMRATNVDGTRHVVDALLTAGVPQLVHASSVGAYSKADKGTRRDETWPTGGIPGSLYGAHKAEAERHLDAVQAAHPELRIARIRPSIVVSAAAAAAQTRLFLGPFLPRAAVRHLPVVPALPGLVLQVVHSEDAAAAFAAAAVRGATGAFNVADEPPLPPRALAQVLGAHAAVPVPLLVARLAVELTWRLRLHPVDRGWLELAVGVPLMDTARARRELGWTPRHDARDALREAIEGIAAGTGRATPVLRPIRSGADQLAGGLRTLLGRDGGRS